MVRTNLARIAVLSLLALSQLLPLIAEDKLSQAIELYESKKYRDAETTLREVLVEDSSNSRARHTLGLVLLELDNAGEAAAELQKAVELGPATDKLQVDLARANVKLKEWDKAEAALKAAEEIKSDNPDIPYYRGMVAAAHKDYAASAAYLAPPAHGCAYGDRPAALGPGLPASPAVGGNTSVRSGRGAGATNPAGDVPCE